MGRSLAATGTVLPTLGRTFWPVRWKILAAEEKFQPPSNFHLLKAFGLRKNTIFVSLTRVIKDKRRVTNFSEVWPLFKIGLNPACRFVRPLHFLFGPFRVMS
jgi:hypothetical protein